MKYTGGSFWDLKPNEFKVEDLIGNLDYTPAPEPEMDEDTRNRLLTPVLDLDLDWIIPSVSENDVTGDLSIRNEAIDGLEGAKDMAQIVRTRVAAH